MKTEYNDNHNRRIVFPHKKYLCAYNKWRDYDLMTAILAFSGLVVAAINYEIDKAIDFVPRDPTKYPDAMDHPANA